MSEQMSQIHVKCTDQVVKIVKAPVIASGGLNEVSVVFDFCEKWDGFVKTALFYRDTDNIYYAVLDDNDTCVVPWEVCYAAGYFFFSVFGEKGSTRRTSNKNRYRVVEGAITEGFMPSEPTPDVYDQIIALVAETKEEAKAFIAAADDLLSNNSQAAENARAATEAANSAAERANSAANNAATNADGANAAAENANNAAGAANQAASAATVATEETVVARESFLETAGETMQAIADVLGTAEPGPAIVCEKSGSVISVNDASDRFLRKLTLYGKTTQGGTPSIANPVKLSSAGEGGSIGVAVKGKNRVDVFSENMNMTRTGTEDTGHEAYLNKVAEDGSVTIDISGDNTYGLGFVKELKAGQEVTISYDILSLGNGTGDGIALSIFDTNDYSSYKKRVYSAKLGRFSCAFTPESDSTYLFGWFVSGGTNPCGAKITDVQLEYGPATEYEPFAGKIVTLSTPGGLPGCPVANNGNYADAKGQQWVCDEIDGMRGKRIHRIGGGKLTDVSKWNAPEAVGSGTYAIVGAPAPSNWYRNTKSYKNGRTNGLFTHGKYQEFWGSGSTHAFMCGAMVYVVVPTEMAPDADTFKAWVTAEAAAGNTPEIMVVLDSDRITETDLAPEEIAAIAGMRTNKPETTIYNDAGAYMTVEYVADTKTFIDAAAPDVFVKPVESAWQQRLLERIDQTMIPMVALADLPKAPSGYIRKGQTMTGINYSAVFDEEGGYNLVGTQVPLSTYYSALENPASKMYTEDRYQDKTGRSSYYGINCSGFVSYVCGFKEWVWTTEMATKFKNKVVPVADENDLFQIRRGDILLNTVESSGDGDHVMIVKDVVCDRRTGRLLGFNIAESWKPFVRVSFRDIKKTLALFYREQPYRLLQLDASDYGLAVAPVAYSKTVYPDKGDGGKYATGETVWLYIPNSAATSITISVDSGEGANILLADMESAYINDVLVYAYVPAAAGTHTICTDLAQDDPCKVVVAG